MQPWLVFVESNTTGTGRRFAALAGELGFRPLVVASDPARYPYVREDALAALTADTGDRAALVSICRELAEREGLAGVGSSSEYFIETSAAVAGELGLAGPDPRAVARCRDKHAQRECLAQAGRASPRFQLARDVEAGVAAARGMGFPLVVKPRVGSGSIGVKLIHDERELRPHLAALVSQVANERGIPIQQGALLEELVIGPEFSVEVFDGRAIALVRKHLSPPPFFVEIGHDHPAGVAEAMGDALQREAERSVAALGLGFGPAHVELRHSQTLGPVVIEVNPRLAGGWIPEMVRLAIGVDLVEQTVRRLAGLPLDLEAKQRRAASIRFLVLGDDPRPDALEAVRRTPGVVEVSLYPPRPDGNVVRGDFRDRIGHVLTSGATREETDALASEALAKLRRRAAVSSGGSEAR